ncbi:MAG: OB-fold protein [Archangium sp.]
MALKCKKCGGDVASNAAACPKCGAPPPRGISFRRLFGIAFKIFVALCVLTWVLAKLGGGDGAAPAKRTVDAKQVELRTLLAEYTDNEVRADAAYKGQLIQTTGVVEDVKRDILNTAYVIVGTGRRYETRQVQCFVDEDQAKAVASLTQGSRITIRGRVAGLMLINVHVKDCELVGS